MNINLSAQLLLFIRRSLIDFDLVQLSISNDNRSVQSTPSELAHDWICSGEQRHGALLLKLLTTVAIWTEATVSVFRAKTYGSH